MKITISDIYQKISDERERAKEWEHELKAKKNMMGLYWEGQAAAYAKILMDLDDYFIFQHRKKIN